MKADKSLHNFTEVLPFSAWPADLIFLYITLTSTVFLSKFPQFVIKKTYEKTVGNSTSLFNFVRYSVKIRDGAERADEMMSTNEDYQ